MCQYKFKTNPIISSIPCSLTVHNRQIYILFLPSVDKQTTMCYYIPVLSNAKYLCCKTTERVIILEHITEMLKGILEGCVLEIISRKETYGYEITRQLNRLGFKDVVEGTVYTILVRFEKNKLVTVQRKPSELGPPRKFYQLNDAGQEELRLFWNKWDFVSSKINELKEKQEHE